jgi:hypothetical protein
MARLGGAKGKFCVDWIRGSNAGRSPRGLKERQFFGGSLITQSSEATLRRCDPQQ